MSGIGATPYDNDYADVYGFSDYGGGYQTVAGSEQGLGRSSAEISSFNIDGSLSYRDEELQRRRTKQSAKLLVSLVKLVLLMSVVGLVVFSALSLLGGLTRELRNWSRDDRYTDNGGIGAGLGGDKFKVHSGTLEEKMVKPGFCSPRDASWRSHTGYYSTANGRKNLFYWFFESQRSTTRARGGRTSESGSAPRRGSGPGMHDPVVLWLSGGPGCSSMTAVFAEVGPCRVTADAKLRAERWAWNARANLLFVDQPAGVGFSYGSAIGHDHNEKEVADDMYGFVQEWMRKHEAYRFNKFFVVGESYGGHYVPAVAQRIFVANEAREGLRIHLSGVAIGNGITDPSKQFSYFADMANHNSYNIKALSDGVYRRMKMAQQPCLRDVARCQQDSSMCDTAKAFCHAEMLQPYIDTHRNIYDVRKNCTYPPLCYRVLDKNGPLTKLLQSDRALDFLHIRHFAHKWQVCNYRVLQDFNADWMRDYQDRTIPLLESKIPLLVYAGDADYICNWRGCKAWTLALPWSGKKQFNLARDEPWRLPNGRKAGEIRSHGGLTFLRLNGAGHLAPMDQPEAAFTMINQFMDGTLGKVTQGK